MSGQEERRLALRIKSKASQSDVLRDVSTRQTVEDFLQRLASMTGVPHDRMTLLCGFPPRRITYDRSALVETLGLNNQDTLIVELDASNNSNSNSSLVTPTNTNSAPDASRVGEDLISIKRPRDIISQRTSDVSVVSSVPSSLGFGPSDSLQSSTLPTVPDFPSSLASALSSSPGSCVLQRTTGQNQMIINALNSSTMRDLDPSSRSSSRNIAHDITAVPNSGTRSSQGDLPPRQTPNGLMLRQVVPSDNSCLFTSVAFALSGTMNLEQAGTSPNCLRELIANEVSRNTERFSEAILGRPNPDYVQWIRRPESWGGGIELSVLSEHYSVEMDVIDIQSLSVSRFGEDMNHAHRIFLLYDGIHYDPLYYEPVDGTRNMTVFPTQDAFLLQRAIDLAREARTARQFTNLSSFSLRCQDCNTPLRGQVEAQEHAKLTGHTSFSEVK